MQKENNPEGKRLWDEAVELQNRDLIDEEKRLRAAAVQRYGDHIHLYGQQRDGFVEGAKWAFQQSSVSEWMDVSDKPLTECMMGRDAECNHPKCPVTDEDEQNGRFCTLPLHDWRQ